MTGTLAVEHSSDLDDAEALLWEWIGRVDDACNRFRTDSELSRLNERPGVPVALSPTLEAALVAALEAARLTDGLCDPTVLPALEALGYDRDYDELAAHGAPSAGEAFPAPGVSAIALDRQGHRVTLAPGCRIDLGASAKALVADAIVAELASRGGALVEVGGDVAARGRGPDGPWVVGVSDRLVVTGHEPRVALRDGGLATSSAAVRTWLAGGRRVNHIVDPRTGAPAEGPYATASVAANSCVAANAYATATLLWGEDAPYHLAQAGVAARLVRRDGTVELVGSWPRDEEVR